MINFYCIECFNKYTDYTRYLAEDAQSIPYLSYDSLATYPNDIKQFKLASSAKNYLRGVMNRDNIDIAKLNMSQRIELIRIGNNNKYFIAKCHIDDANNFIVESKEVASEFTRNWSA